MMGDFRDLWTVLAIGNHTAISWSNRYVIDCLPIYPCLMFQWPPQTNCSVAVRRLWPMPSRTVCEWIHRIVLGGHWSSARTEKSWWRHQMETFSALLTLCAGNSPVTGEFPTKASDAQFWWIFLICACMDGWINNREVGDLRRHRTHYDVTVMWRISFYFTVAFDRFY